MIPLSLFTRHTNKPSTAFSNTITVWQGCVDHQEHDYQHYWALLDAQERYRAQQFKYDVLRQRYVSVHGQLRMILAQTLSQKPQTLIIDKTEYGKPYLVDYPQLAFNLSHSGDYFAIALGWNYQLGIDLEVPKERFNLVGLVEKTFAKEEAAYWQLLPDDQKTAEFYRFWTRKEAFVKATGQGITLGLQHCVINPHTPSCFLRLPKPWDNPSDWHLRDLELQDSATETIYIAFCANRALSTLEIKQAKNLQR